MQVELISLGVELSLTDGESVHVLTLRLPNEATVKAIISEESAGRITDLIGTRLGPKPAVERRGPTAADRPVLMIEKPMVVQKEFAAQADGTMVFGGAPEPELPGPPPPPPPRPKIVRVEKDEMGYPIVRTNGGVDPSDTFGGQDPDEDGVGQI